MVRRNIGAPIPKTRKTKKESTASPLWAFQAWVGPPGVGLVRRAYWPDAMTCDICGVKRDAEVRRLHVLRRLRENAAVRAASRRLGRTRRWRAAPRRAGADVEGGRREAAAGPRSRGGFPGTRRFPQGAAVPSGRGGALRCPQGAAGRLGLSAWCLGRGVRRSGRGRGCGEAGSRAAGGRPGAGRGVSVAAWGVGAGGWPVAGWWKRVAVGVRVGAWLAAYPVPG